MKLVKKPVHVEKGGRKLVKDESWAIKVDEWTLLRQH